MSLWNEKQDRPVSGPGAAAPPIQVAALYKFVALPDYAALRAPLQAVCNDAGLCGTLLLAPEGINGTIAGPPGGIDAVLTYLGAQPPFCDLEVKLSYAGEYPFYRMKVRLKKEIVTMGKPAIDPNRSVGTYIEPENWNALIARPDVLVVDARNDYEVAIGSFEGAVNPGTKTFREFPDWVERLKSQPTDERPKKLAMFCTGGIRCEKATAYMLEQGFDEVYHLKGGILKYLEQVPTEQSLWRGDCFVFDQRVSVRHGLALGDYDLCHACRRPIDETDKASPDYVPGVSCPQCRGAFTPRQERRFAERQKQMELAAQRNQPHLGASHPRKTGTALEPDL